MVEGKLWEEEVSPWKAGLGWAGSVKDMKPL